MRTQHLLMSVGLVVSVLGASWAAARPAVDVVDTFHDSGVIASREHRVNGRRDGRFETWWPDGTRRSSVEYRDDVFHGEYRTWMRDGRPYELKHFADGREQGLQQAWDEDGRLYLNYEVRNGRRFGLANAKPCLPANSNGTSEVLP